MNASRDRIYIAHMLEAIGNIREDTANGDNLDFANDRRLRQLVERNLEIVSEASRRLSDGRKARFPAIPWRQIADLGNVMRHEYQRVSPIKLGLTVEKDLSPLEEVLRQMLAGLEE